jgi:hypothetical protein
MSNFSDYLQAISRVNGLVYSRVDGRENSQKIQWLFHCGMLFESKDKWWGDFKFRHCPHEGIDITYYRTYPDEMHRFDDSIKVPAMDDGILLNICDDFLAQTLVVEHGKSILFDRRILFVYAHIIPEKSLKLGHIIKKGDVIARVSDTHKNPQLPPHIHFSCFEVLRKVQPKYFNWNLFSKNNEVNLIHPVSL